MRFAVHSPQLTGAVKIDWRRPVELTGAIRRAMAGHDVEQMHVGVVVRGCVVDDVTYPRGTIAFQVADGHELFLQLPFEDPRDTAPVRTPTSVMLVDEVAGDERYRITMGDQLAGERVDIILAMAVPDLSRAVAQRLIDDGHVTVGGARATKASQRPRCGDVVEVLVPNAAAS